MKKSILIAIGLSLLLGNGLFFVAVKASVPGREKLNLSSFEGRIYASDRIQPGTFAIDTPFEDALLWGKNAIMSYDWKAIKVSLKPKTWGKKSCFLVLCFLHWMV